jgi:hypothetical protein
MSAVQQFNNHKLGQCYLKVKFAKPINRNNDANNNNNDNQYSNNTRNSNVRQEEEEEDSFENYEIEDDRRSNVSSNRQQQRSQDRQSVVNDGGGGDVTIDLLNESVGSCVSRKSSMGRGQYMSEMKQKRNLISYSIIIIDSSYTLFVCSFT